MKTKRDREEPCHICNHYHDVENAEPCKVCGHVMSVSERRQQDTVLPTAIIPGCLYLGSYDTASRSEILKAMGITHILNTVPTSPALFRNTFTYHTVTSALVDFQECFQFIDEAGKGDHKVLVYCMTGVSRSPSVVIAYLMRHRGWRLAESYKWVKDKRPSIHLKPDDSKRLMEYEMQLMGSCSAPLGLQALDTGASFLQQAPAAEASQASSAPSSSAAPMFGDMSSDQPQWSLGASSAASQQQPFSFGSEPQQLQGPAPGQPHFVFGAATAVVAAPSAGGGAGGTNDMEL